MMVKLVPSSRQKPEKEELASSRQEQKCLSYVLSLSGTGFMSVQGGKPQCRRVETCDNSECNDCELFVPVS
ncbi:hypothetical protein [Alternaria brassicicola fusarivirus 1]|uniref:Uncharacterized protein n=1 Tax=Alternaria brassicicola fusarivirus 1 TaxID=1766767 RepID=A0A0U4B4N9_9VIRU|nr:hypothetical protein AXH27_gp2 [Alternaria brassicicola fusarivirus 1]ALW95413.1 hypothetical protein [Alternaria brassicicola fusarivirus 1]